MRLRTLPSTWTPWPAAAFPGALGGATTDLRNLVYQRIDHLGALRDPCQGRVLETVLMLRLLERTGSTGHRAQHAALRRYLDARRDTGDAVDRLLVHGALDRPVQVWPDVAAGFLHQVPSFTAVRKRMMLDAFLVLLDAPRGPASYPAGAFCTIGLHSWAAAQVTAIKVILARQGGCCHEVRDGDVELLLATQRTPWIWEGNLLIHLSALHALHGLPGTAQVILDGIDKALRCQRADGSMPFVTDTDTWCTATAGVALAEAGAEPDDLARIARHLLRQQRPNGGWAYTDLAHRTDADDTAVTCEFLHTLDPRRYADAIQQGLQSLLGIQDSSGGFPTYVAGAPAEPCMTAAAINALSTQPAAHQQAIRSGLDFLVRHQDSGGGFAPDWSASRHHTLFRSALAAGALGEQTPQTVQRMGARILEAVEGSQNHDGGWGQQPGHPSDALSTAYALITVCRQPDPRPAVRAAAYLLDQRDDAGHISTVPDSIGPRGFVFTVPALADIFALLALGHLRQRIGGARPATQAYLNRRPAASERSLVAPVSG